MFAGVTNRRGKVHYYTSDENFDFLSKSHCGIVEENNSILKVGSKTKREVCKNCMRVANARVEGK